MGLGVDALSPESHIASPLPKCFKDFLRYFGVSDQGLGFRVQGLNFRVSGLGFRVQGLNFRVSGLGFSVQGLGFRVSGFG